MKREFTAVIKKSESWWIGWIEEIAGVNSQGKTRKELIGNLESALAEMTEINREEALREAGVGYTEVAIAV